MSHCILPDLIPDDSVILFYCFPAQLYCLSGNMISAAAEYRC